MEISSLTTDLKKTPIKTSIRLCKVNEVSFSKIFYLLTDKYGIKQIGSVKFLFR